VKLRAGFARVDITPPVPAGGMRIPLLGFWPERAKRFERVHDPLYARAMVLDDGRTCLAVVACDSIGDAVGYGDRAKRRIAAEAGLAAGQVVILASHTHTAPETIGLCFETVDARWLEELAGRIASAVALARRRLQPAVLQVGGRLVTELTRNRRSDHRRSEYSGRLGRAEVEFGPIDPELWVLYAGLPDGRPLGMLVNFACHPVCVQTMPMVSADFVGVTTGALEDRYGPGFVALFANGAAGQVNPVRIDSLEAMQWQGERLAAEVQAVVEAVRTGEAEGVDGPLVAAGRSLQLDRRTDLPDLEHIRRELAARRALCDARGPDGRADRSFAPARELYELRNLEAVHMRPGRVAVPLSVVGCGPWRLVGVGGELFCQLGMAIKQALPQACVMVAGYADGYVGYIADESAFEAGGYEVQPAPWSLLARGAGERIRDAAIRLAREAG